MRFGIDIDGTITDPASLVPFLNEAFKLNLSYEDMKEYDLLKVIEVPKLIFEEWYNKNEADIYNASPLAMGAKAILSEWSKIHELILISARGNQYLQLTRDWLLNNDISYHHVELIGSHNKIKTANKYKVDIFLEDKLDNALAIHDALDIPVILFDTPYNQASLPAGVVRVHDWLEAHEWVKNWIRESCS